MFTDYIDLKNFELKNLISKGFCSDIYFIEKKDTGQIYVAKILHCYTDINCPGKYQIIYQDMNTIVKLKHPSIINFIGISPIDFQNNLNPVIITEYYKNKSLKEIHEIVTKGLFTQIWTETNRLITIYGIASGMAFLHSNQILHRDLKPSNILFDDNLYPLISDFDLSIKISSTNEPDNVGTLIYMAPEIFEKCEYSKSSDVYAFSIILFEIMTNEEPYENPKSFNFAKKIQENYRPNIKPEYKVPPAYKKLMEACWDKDPKKRPSFDQIVTLLRNDKSFITGGVYEEEYLDYIEYIDLKMEALNNLAQKRVSDELQQKLNGDQQKIKFYVIQDAMQQLNYHIVHKNDDFFAKESDLDKFKATIHQNYIDLSQSISKDQIDEDIKSIDKSINEEYDRIKSYPLLSSSSIILNQIIDILENIGSNKKDITEAQEKINDILDKHDGELLFNKRRLKNISNFEFEYPQILTTLKAIQQNPILKNLQLKKNPKLSILYSSKNKCFNYSKSLSNILDGNCFFISLYGKPLCTHKILSSILNQKIDHHENDDITIYGPIDLVSFGNNDDEIFQKVRKFNGCYPNIYFFEISDESDDWIFSSWHDFIFCISHFLIFCDDQMYKYRIKKFKQKLQYINSDFEMINCLPFSNFDVKYDKIIKASVNADYDYFNDSKFRQYIIESIITKKTKFIPSNTVASISHLILEKKLVQIFNDKKI